MALSSGQPLNKSIGVIWDAFTDSATIELALSVFTIGVFSTIMNTTGYLENMVQGLSGFLGNLKAAIMTVPALIGSMPVSGGAAVSAPLVDKLGDGLDLTPDIKASVNLVFRHGMFFLFPFSPAMIMASNMIGVPIGTLISKLWPYGVSFCLAGYWVLLRKTGASHKNLALSSCSTEKSNNGDVDLTSAATETSNFKTKSLLSFLQYGAPLLLALTLSIFFHMPLWSSMTAGISLGIIMARFEKAPLPSISTVVKGSNIPQVIAMLWIMAFKDFASTSPVFPALVDSAKGIGIPPVMLAMVLPIVFGFVTAHQATTVGVMIPILMPAGISTSAVLYFTSVIYGSSFISYFSSPLHLCQVLTCQYYDVSLAKVYKIYWPVLLSVATIMIVNAVIATRLI